MTETYTDTTFARHLLTEAQAYTHLDDAELAYHLSRRPGIGRVTLQDVQRWKSGEERIPFDVGIAVRDMAKLPIPTGEEDMAHRVRNSHMVAVLRRMLAEHPGRTIATLLAGLGTAYALFRWKALTITGAALAASIVAGGFLATQPPSQPIVATSTPSASSTPIPATLITAPPLDPQARDEVPAPTPSPTASPVQGAMTATASPTPVPTVAPTPQPSAVPTPTPTPLPAAAPAPRCHPRLAALAKRAAVRARLLRGC